MMSIVKNYKWAIWVTTFTLFIYCFLVAAQLQVWLTGIIFVASPFLILWMVWRVLKDDFTTEKTFQDYFYQDSDIRRVHFKAYLEMNNAKSNETIGE